MIEFGRAKEGEKIIEKLCELFYPEWQGLDIICLFRSESFQDSPRTVARIQKLQGLKAWLYWQTDGFNEPLFVIQIVKEKYDLFEPSQQIAVLDHELSHLYFSDVTGEPCINPNHDIEENSIIVKRHGAWHGGLESFYKSLQIGAENQSLREEILNRVRE